MPYGHIVATTCGCAPRIHPSHPQLLPLALMPSFEFICFLSESSSPQATNSLILRYRIGTGMHRALLPASVAIPPNLLTPQRLRQQPAIRFNDG
jgi:hypothetical protein